MKCPKCGGKGFIEHEHGLIMVECGECKGTGEIEGDSSTPDNSITRTPNSRKPRKRKVSKKA